MSRLAKLLPLALPLIVRWAERAEQHILAEGDPLSPTGLQDAVAMGVGRAKKSACCGWTMCRFPESPGSAGSPARPGCRFFPRRA